RIEIFRHIACHICCRCSHHRDACARGDKPQGVTLQPSGLIERSRVPSRTFMRRSRGIFNLTRAIVVAAIAALAAGSTHASAIREFDLRTVESLGRPLYEHENQSPKSLSGPGARELGAAE